MPHRKLKFIEALIINLAGLDKCSGGSYYVILVSHGCYHRKYSSLFTHGAPGYQETEDQGTEYIHSHNGT